MKQFRNTAARTEILRYICESGKALSHPDIQEGAGVSCDRVTIYRVLDRLQEEGLVHKVIDIDGTVRYAACHSCGAAHAHTHSHVHFSCSKCHSVTCLEQVQPELRLPRKYKMQEVHFMVSGICAACS